MEASGETTAQAQGSAKAVREKVYTKDYLRLFAAEVCVFIGFYFVLPIIPLYVLDLGGTNATAGLLLGIAAATGLVTTPLYGRTADALGRKTVLLFGLIVTAVSMASFALVRVIWLLAFPLIGRQTGFSGYQTASRTLAFDVVPASRRGEAISTFLLAPNLAIAFGPAVGLFLMRAVDVRLPFIIASLLCVVALALVSGVPEARSGAVVPHAAAGRGRGGWLVKEALFPASVQFLLAMSYLASTAFVSVVAEERGISGYHFFFTAYAAVVITVRSLAGRASDRYGRAAVLVPALISQIAAVSLIALAQSLPVLILAALLFGTGWGAAFPTLTTLIADRVEPARRGTAMGFFSSAFALGSTLGPASLGVISDAAGFTVAYFAMAAFVVAALTVAVTGFYASGQLRVKARASR